MRLALIYVSNSNFENSPISVDNQKPYINTCYRQVSFYAIVSLRMNIIANKMKILVTHLQILNNYRYCIYYRCVYVRVDRAIEKLKC